MQVRARTIFVDEGHVREERRGWSARATAMGEAACSPSCAGRLCGRQPCATVLVVQAVHHHRHQRLRHHLPPRKQRLLPTLTWQMSVTPATKPETLGPAEREPRTRRLERAPRSSVTTPEGDRQTPQATLGSTFTRFAKCSPLVYNDPPPCCFRFRSLCSISIYAFIDGSLEKQLGSFLL